MLRVMGHVLTVIFVSIIAPLSHFLSQEDGLIDTLYINKVISNGPLIKQMFLLLGTCLTPIIISILWRYSTYRLSRIKRQRTDLIRYIKEIFEITWQNKTKTNLKDLNIRIFVPVYKLNKVKSFRIRNVEGLSTVGNTRNLEFEIYPKCQGFVGRCFKEKKVVYENNLAEHPDHSLNEFQITKTQNLKFVLCAPILDPKNKVLAIISFDSTETIKISNQNEKEITDFVLNFSYKLYESVPDLFK